MLRRVMVIMLPSCVHKCVLLMQDASEAVKIKQAKLGVLQQAARDHIPKLLKVADLDGLALCLSGAQHAGLGPNDIAAIQTRITAVEHIKAAVKSGDMEELAASLQSFEQLCKPGGLKHTYTFV